jgi:CopG family transcriptional regulator/antitoxin EndoAI
MAGSTVNISFSKELLAEIDETAKQESRTRSELIREAARLYIGRKARWERIFAFGSRQARRLGLREEEIAAEIRKYRAKIYPGGTGAGACGDRPARDYPGFVGIGG